MCHPNFKNQAVKKCMHHRIKYIWDMCQQCRSLFALRVFPTLLHIRLMDIKINLGQNQTIRPYREAKGVVFILKIHKNTMLPQKLQWVARIEDPVLAADISGLLLG